MIGEAGEDSGSGISNLCLPLAVPPLLSPVTRCVTPALNSHSAGLGLQSLCSFVLRKRCHDMRKSSSLSQGVRALNSNLHHSMETSVYDGFVPRGRGFRARGETGPLGQQGFSQVLLPGPGAVGREANLGAEGG